MSLSTIAEALEALRAGRPVLVADDENARERRRRDPVGRARHARVGGLDGALVVRLHLRPMPTDLADHLNLPPMVAASEDARSTAYTVSVDAAEGVTTGISAHDRAHTLNVLANPGSTATSIIRPGHVLPLCAPSTVACASAVVTPKPPSS